MIKIKNLSKTYELKGKKIEALKSLNLEIKDNEIFGLLGTNGAGKTTTIKLLTTLLAPTSGTAYIDNFDIRRHSSEIRKKIGVVFGKQMIYHRLTGRDNLKFYGEIYGVSDLEQKIEELADFFEMGQWLDTLVEAYSNGMRTKLAIMRGLINDPSILFLDEPTLGLDPNMALKVREKIKDLQKRGKTIILTTHYMIEAEQLCDRIAILNKGRLVAIDTARGLRRKIPGRNVLEVEFERIDDISKIKNEFILTEDGDQAMIPVQSAQHLNYVLKKILEKNLLIRDIRLVEPSLERVFAYYTE